MTYPAGNLRSSVLACLALAGVLVPRAACGEPSEATVAPPPQPAPAAAPALPTAQAVEETAPVTFRDSGKATVTLRVPVSLHRPANAFRLYGPRPLTLRDRGRRSDLYRDAFLELATRARVTPAVNMWASREKQLGLGPVKEVFQALDRQPPSFPHAGPLWEAISRRPQLSAMAGALTSKVGSAVVDIQQPVADALLFRALATDEAERRLVALEQELDWATPGADPAMRTGYQAARAEFDQVRQGLWPALAASVRKHQGRLAVTAVKDLALSRLGYWAIFGYMGWQALESVLNVEYHGQYAICLATTAARLAARPASPEAPAGSPQAIYAEYVLNYELTEALKAGGVMPLKAAGGRSVGDWQIRFSGRCEELRKALSPGQS